MFKDKCLLITGGTGSFGNEVLKRILKMDAGEIRIFSRDEKKQDEMRKKFNNNKIKFYIGDVRDEKSIVRVMKGVDYVFHAAALKQVPSCEFFPMEAFKTNVLGTENVLDCAIAEKVKKVICLSTDKAVYPINSMGISKAMMEKIMLSKSRMLTSKSTILCATRYGNLICSRGSVLPTLIRQILNHKPLTVTQPDMTRYFMTLDEAIELVLFAFKHATQGDIFVQKSPAARIGDLVIALKEVFQCNNPVQEIGIRHGEKMYETLLTNQELLYAEDLGLYYKIPVDTRSLNYMTYNIGVEESINNNSEYNSHNAKRLNISELKELLLKQDEVRKAIEYMRANTIINSSDGKQI
ncbi:MAG: polysaccharide biosynthesis protein [Clostridiaceae bacterium]|jgi:UDP-glucose 4-epimerase|nr:polysaccharide biosynthesis protein [Clostridiaceae bacterium]